MFTLKNEPLHASQIIQQGFLLYRSSFFPMLPYVLTTAIFAFFLRWVLASHLFFLALYSVAWLVLMCALMFRLYCSCYQISNNFIDTCKHAVIKSISLLTIGLIYSLIVLSATMLLIVPGIIFTISLMFSFILIVVENESILNTLLMSHRLVWGQWWHTFTVMSFIFLAYLVIILALFTLISVLGMHQYWLLVFNAILQAFFIPLIFSTALVLLHDLSIRQK